MLCPRLSVFAAAVVLDGPGRHSGMAPAAWLTVRQAAQADGSVAAASAFGGYRRGGLVGRPMPRSSRCSNAQARRRWTVKPCCRSWPGELAAGLRRWQARRGVPAQALAIMGDTPSCTARRVDRRRGGLGQFVRIPSSNRRCSFVPVTRGLVGVLVGGESEQRGIPPPECLRRSATIFRRPASSSVERVEGVFVLLATTSASSMCGTSGP